MIVRHRRPLEPLGPPVATDGWFAVMTLDWVRAYETYKEFAGWKRSSDNCRLFMVTTSGAERLIAIVEPS